MFKLIAEQKILLAALQSVNGVVDRKNTIPVLSNVLITPGHPAKITGTNLEIGKIVEFPAECPDGATPLTLPAQKLIEILRECEAGTVTIEETEGSWCDIASGKSQFRIAGLPVTDFPEPTISISGGVTATLPADVLARAVARTAFAVSHDESRYALTGVRVELEPGTLRTVATDGHRLAVCAVACAAPAERAAIVPVKALQEVVKDAEGDVVLTLGEAQAAFEWPGAQLVTRLIDGQFPDYAQIIPQSGKLLHVVKGQFVAAIRRVALLGGDSKLIRLDVTADTVKLSARDPQHGEAQETLPAAWNGEPLAVGFNARYLLDAASVLTGDDMTVLLTDPLSPGAISEDKTSLIIMPMRV